MKYVIIGNATAAIGTVEGIRSVDKYGEIVLISSEPHFTYGRPLISYLLLGKTTEEKMNYRPLDFYETNHVTTLLGRTVTSIDKNAKAVVLENGEKVSYDKLAICTGSRPFVPPMEGLDTVEAQTPFMTLDDAHRLSALLGDQKDKDVLIIGAGLIGLKCAEGILHLSKSLTIVDMAPRILPNVLDDYGSSFLQTYLEGLGMKFYLSDSVARFSTPNHAVFQSGMELDFDVLVVAVGVRPNTGLAEEIGCEVNRGILVDTHSATTVPDVYAAGDCTVSHDIAADTDRILAILPNAYQQGEAAGVNMAGGDKVFDQAFPMNASGFLGLHMITAGSYDGEAYVTTTEDSYKKLVVRDNKLVGFILIGDVDRGGIYTSLIRDQVPLDTIDFDLIRQHPQLMAFAKSERAKKLAQPH
ncbi:MAG TPA: FAD-dependent oxidoreductase [Candidatus Butyricicoccus stercorigallinarum]|nr:FAD-dependent oxidoreductase [Candidatus Butyricicoccus stercorigallinarum]